MRLRGRTIIVALIAATSSFIAMPRASAAGYTAVAVGNFHACALTSSGAVYCWGDNASNQLGDGTRVSSSSPQIVPGVTDAAAIAAGQYHACALASSGDVRCWGSNGRGQLGAGSFTDPPGAVTVAGLSGARAISVGAFHSCALTSAGGVKCWGRNDLGQLGIGVTGDRTTPVDVNGLTSGVSAISAGAYHTCALLNDGTARCWGYNQYGQIGNGTRTNQLNPVPVAALSRITQVAAGGLFSCAVNASNDLHCWGDNSLGELGGSGPSSTGPVLVSALTGRVALVSTGAYYACAIRTDGTLACWGYNDSGQLGRGTIGGISNVPTTVGGVSAATGLATGVNETCVIAAGGLWCFGNNAYGQLGNGVSGASSGVPVHVPFPDSTPPEVAVASVDCSDHGDNGWCRGTVTVTFDTNDPGTGVASPCAGPSCTFARASSAEGGSISIAAGAVCDNAGNCGTGPSAGPFKIDGTAPTTALVGSSCADPGSNGWCRSAVVAEYTAADAVSGVASPCSGSSCGYTLATNGDGDALTLGGSVCDEAGNCASAPEAGPFKVDATAPSVTCEATPTFTLAESGATVAATVSDVTSGAIHASVGEDVSTSSVGTHTVALTGADEAGNTTTVECAYKVVYDWDGFFAPYSNSTWNEAKAGRSMPLKFSLAGDHGLRVVERATVTEVNCGTRAALGDPAPAGLSGKSYDATSDTYMVKWSTVGAWGGTCRVFDLELIDGTHHELLMKFR